MHVMRFVVITAWAWSLHFLSPQAQDFTWYVSSVDGERKLAEATGVFETRHPRGVPVIELDPTTRHQTVFGMGSSLEPTTAYNLAQLDAVERDRVLRLLVHPDGANMNLMRICMGTPDFTGDPWYSYNDLPPGETDIDLSQFSIEKDRDYIVPVIKEALAINPNLRFFASPWSPPGWMTSTGDMIGGHLLPEFYSAYAEYFVRFIKAYEAEGIPIYAVTIQNEPGVDRSLEEDPKWHYPSCRWTGEQERDFIRDHLGPAFEREGIATRIWCFDHNFNERPAPGDDGIAHPTVILSDSEAARHVDGVAFHGYVGRPAGMSVFQKCFPDARMHFTEGSVFGLRGGIKLMDYFRNGIVSYNAWVTVIDENGGPNNGPFEASRTIITRDSPTNTVKVHFDYYLYNHFMRFIRPGAVRLESSDADASLANIAFENADGSWAVVVINNADADRDFAIRIDRRSARLTIPAQSVGTWVTESPAKAAR